MAKRSRGTPLANRLLKKSTRFCTGKYDGKITKEVADFAMDLLEVDRYGLDEQTDFCLPPLNGFSEDLWGWIPCQPTIGEDANH